MDLVLKYDQFEDTVFEGEHSDIFESVTSGGGTQYWVDKLAVAMAEEYAYISTVYECRQ